jgi:D-tyrosyl-tRNA(Tyr) deacylase
MNYSLDDVKGEILLISQFTLFASTKKGNRPSYIDAAPPGMAIPLYEKFIESAEASLGSRLKTGIFGADMKVSLINDGPVTIQIDSKNKA